MRFLTREVSLFSIGIFDLNELILERMMVFSFELIYFALGW